jgi:hydrophobic/amphiphilic exporter-1 (mainly G- bacteria), HAE1 family
MWLTRVFLLRPTLGFVIVVLTLIAGYLALQNLVVQEQPNTGLPTITITAPFAGASTTDLQTEIAQPIEDHLAGQPYLVNIRTTIESGSVSIAAIFSLQSTTTEDIANVESGLQAAARDLPTTVQPTLRVSDPDQPTVVTLALVSKKYDVASLGALAENTIVPVIEQLPGVSTVNVGGTTVPAFMVRANPNLLAANNLTVSDIVNAITPNNLRPPGGYVYQPGRETTLDVRGDLPDPQTVANLPIQVTSNVPIAASGGSGAASGTTTAATGSSAFSSASTSAGTAVAVSTATPASAISKVPTVNATVPPLNLAGFAAPTSAPTAAASPVVAPSTVAGGASVSTTTTSGTNTTTTSSTSTSTTPTASPTTMTLTNGTTGANPTGAFAMSAPAASALTTTATTSTSPTTLTNQSATVSVPLDTPIAPTTLTSTSATSTGTALSTVAPSVTSSAFGGGSGTSATNFVGQLGNWSVPSANKRISDVSTVEDSTVVPRIQALLNNKPGVVLLIAKQATASEVTVSDEVLRQLPALRRQFPGISFQVAHVQSTFTEEQVESVEHTLIEGIILTAVVMLFFLGSWRNAVVVMVAIPTSLGVTLFVMWMLGLTLDTISLMAMTLVIGILIDDSTVVLENVTRHYTEGEEPPDAALNGRSEIGLAAIVLTLVDVIVFFPIAFAGGEVGQNLHEFAIVMTVATLTSLFVSFTITPLLAGLWSLNSTWRPWRVIGWFERRLGALRDRYANKWLPAAMARPWPILAAAVLLIAAAYSLVPTGRVGEEYIPAEDQGIIFAQITYPPGHPLSETEASVARLGAATMQVISPVDLEYAVALSGAFSAPYGGFVQEGNAGQLSIYLSSDRKTSTYQYIDLLQKRFAKLEPTAGITVTAATQVGGGNQQSINEMVATTNNTDPTAYAAKVYAALKSTPGSAGVQNSASDNAPQMEVQFNRPMLQALNVTSGTAAAAVEASFGGFIASQIETPLKGLTDIEVIYPESEQTSLSEVLQIPIRAQTGGIVRLGDVASLAYVPAPLVINRVNRTEIVYITGNVAPGYQLSDVVKTFQNRLAAMHLPNTVTLQPAALGQQDLLNQALVALLTSLAFSILLVFLVIVALYNSYRTPFVTLFAIPLATIGALAALWITHGTLNLYSLIGIILLVGLVTKNGILLVDYADTVREHGASKDDGMQQAAATRFRPIIMTTVAMISGMLPLALGLEPGAQSRASLGIVVIGGLLSSLVLTLFIVPIMYHWLAPDKLKERTKFGLPRRTRQPG